MKKVLIKIISILFTITLLFSGCTKKSTQGLEPWVKNNNLKPVTLTFCFPGEKPPRLDKIVDTIEKKAYNELHVKLKFVCLPANYDKKVRFRIQDGEPTDVMLLNRGNVQSFLDDDMLQDLSRLFPKYAPDYYSSYNNKLLQDLQYNGELIGIPENQFPTYTKYKVFVRNDLLKKYGIKEIKGLSDYEKFLQLVKENDSNIIPLTTTATTIDMFANANGYTILDSDLELVYKRNDPQMKLIPWEQTPAYRDAINKLYYWYTCGFITKYDSSENLYTDDVLASGKYASFIGICTPSTEEYHNNLLKSMGSNWRYSLFDLNPGVKAQYISSGSYFLSFNKKSPNADRALMLLEWLHSDIENYKLLMYGVKGEDYIVDKYNNPVHLQDDSQPYMSWWGLQPFSSIHENVSGKPGYTESIRKDERGNNRLAEFPQHHGFHFNRDQVLRDSGFSYIGDQNMGRSSNKPVRGFGNLEKNIYTGTYSPDDLDSYVNSQKPPVQSLVLELQSQLDKWRQSCK